MPALYGGIIMALVSSIPFISFINCFCCAGIILGGFLAVFFYKNNMTPESPPLNAGDSMVVGLLSGFIGAVMGSILSMVFISLFGNVMGDALLRWVRGMNIDLPEQSLKALEDATRKSASVANFLIQLFAKLLVYGIFGLLGGLIGYSVYKPKQLTMMPPPPPAAMPQ